MYSNYTPYDVWLHIACGLFNHAIPRAHYSTCNTKNPQIFPDTRTKNYEILRKTMYYYYFPCRNTVPGASCGESKHVAKKTFDSMYLQRLTWNPNSKHIAY